MKVQLHEQLKNLRLEKNLSIEELSKRTQIGVEKLMTYESGEQVPSTQTILVLSTILEVPVSNLIDGLSASTK
ncbi:MAG: helix-turn-helix transcriptional regulator [Solibacillus sp.]|uniref:helix-turn-helix domain-containing protein n=1 Tax=unclassified Solibacillus TaxID=2637870 RepID=UPI0030F97859